MGENVGRDLLPFKNDIMKTAIILFNTIDKTTHPATFLSICSDKACMADYTVIHSSYWKEYISINMRDFVEKVYPSVDAFFLFVDFGVSPLMVSIIEECYKREESNERFTKEIHIELALFGKNAGIGSILAEVSEVMKVPVDLLKSKTRERPISEARQFYFKRARLFTKASAKRIGELVNRDHATVLHGVKVVDGCPTLSDRYEELFEGKKRERKLPKPVAPEKISIQDMAILIGRSSISARGINVTSPFADKEPSNNKPYSGYRVHSL